MYIILKQFKKDYCLTKIALCTVEIGYDITSVFSLSSEKVVFRFAFEAKIISKIIILKCFIYSELKYLLNKNTTKCLEKWILFTNIYTHKVQTFTEVLLRKAEGIDPLKP